MDFMTLAEKRYSVRKYMQKPVEAEKLQAILEAGRLAPTGANRQPQKVYVLQSPEMIDRFKSVCKHHYGAPIVLLVCADENIAWHSPWNETYNCAEIDISIVITFMMMEAVELGLGTLLVRGFNPQDLATALELPKQWKPMCGLLIGYEAQDSQPHALHFANKELSELVEIL